MARKFNKISLNILEYLNLNPKSSYKELKLAVAPQLEGKDFYNYLFRLQLQELIEKKTSSAIITEEGKKFLQRAKPQKDGIWKLVIFDIPEKHKYVRTVLRAKLKQLHFKKWQNSIWVSPFALDQEIEKELNHLGEKFFVRLIKTTEINNTSDLKKMFD